MNTTKVNKNKSHPQPSKIENEKVRKKKAKRKRKNSFKSCRKETKNNQFSMAMSTWAQNFTMASNWQMKHELAFWKARAKTLEYENGLLHDIIKKNYLKTSEVLIENDQDNESENQQDKGQHNNIDGAQCYKDNVKDDDDDCMEDDNDEFVVSEEFIEFVRANAKFKEDARLERERLKKQQDTTEQQVEEDNVMTEDKLKELYGEKWQKICALEMSLLTDLMNKKEKATFWPNIPFNFS
ncbi:RNA polymerase II subunit 5-mediating protein homolog [Pieris rapae]|uniref:RNA polymerase II subunit 5-mediating protein homolog n=1 Tax=Pieris rapae TaxID=64459 RepID=UPI001E27CF5B|nr:RNA polymerase II subunit 5-mediating protein homolog [Pieris rapae]